MIKKHFYILLLLSGLLMGCFHQVDIVEEVEVIDEEVLEETLGDTLEEIVVDEEINDAISTDDSVDVVIIEETPVVVEDIVVEIVEEDVDLSDSEERTYETHGWFADSILPVSIGEIGNGLSQDVYYFDDKIVEVFYDIEQTDAVRELCVGDVINNSEGDILFDDIRKIGCMEFVYSGGYVLLGDLKIPGQDFWMVTYYDESSSFGQPSGLLIDRCENHSGEIEISEPYQTIYNYCSSSQQLNSIGYKDLLHVSLSDSSTQIICNSGSSNLTRNSYVSCMDHDDSICAELIGNVCYSTIVSEGYDGPERNYYYDITEGFNAITDQGYYLFTQSNIIGNRMIYNL